MSYLIVILFTCMVGLSGCTFHQAKSERHAKQYVIGFGSVDIHSSEGETVAKVVDASIAGIGISAGRVELGWIQSTSVISDKANVTYVYFDDESNPEDVLEIIRSVENEEVVLLTKLDYDKIQ
tara:strand:- start:2 stop:370 length:369 start_codon:yes stop_codon:yes gene_type:complete